MISNEINIELFPLCSNHQPMNETNFVIICTNNPLREHQGSQHSQKNKEKSQSTYQSSAQSINNSPPTKNYMPSLKAYNQNISISPLSTPHPPSNSKSTKKQSTTENSPQGTGKAKVSCSTKADRDTKVTGKTIRDMEMGSKSFRMGAPMKENTDITRWKGWGSTLGLKGRPIKENGPTTSSMERELG